MKLRLLAAVAAAGLCAGAATAQELAMAGDAPLVCGAGVTSGDAVTPGSAAALHEFCNDPDGYDVYVDYPSTLAGATLAVGSDSYALTPAGTVRVTHASRPGAATRNLLLSVQDMAAVNLTIRVMPAHAAQVALGGQ